MINLDRLEEYPIVSIDVETTGLHWYRDEMFGVAVAVYDGEKIHSGYWDTRDKPQIVEILANKAKYLKKVVNHSIKFDAHFLMGRGIYLPHDRIECTMVRAALINEHEPSFSLDSLGKLYVGQGKPEGIYEELARLFGGNPTRTVQMANLHRAPASLAAKYATTDPEIAIKLWLWQEEEIKRQGLEQVWDLERRLTPVLIDMEEHGVRVDEERAHNSLGKIDIEVSANQRRLNDLIGGSLNVNSSPQMRKVFGVKKVEAPTGFAWETDRGFRLTKTDGGEASIGKDSLISMSDLGDDRAKLVLTIRKLVKAKSFLKDHIIGHAVDGRVFCNYNQTRGDNELGTKTGRFSVDDPALQQIPARDKEIAEIVRSCFLPEEGDEWACSDFSQFEQRWFAHYANDPQVLKTYQDNAKADFYQVIADITGLPRNPEYAGQANAKQMTLAAIFGMGAGLLAQKMGMPYTVGTWKGRESLKAGPEAVEALDKFYSAVPGIRKHLEMASSIAKSRGYVRTVGGRHLRFPNGEFTHKAGGLVLQGSAADCLKLKMIQIHENTKNTGIKMLLSVHDEIDLSVPPTARYLTDNMIRWYTTFDGVDGPKCRVPIVCELNYGENWYVASK